MTDLAKQVLSGCHARVEDLRGASRPAAEVLLSDQEEKQKQWGIPRPAWREKYLKAEQAEKPPGE